MAFSSTKIERLSESDTDEEVPPSTGGKWGRERSINPGITHLTHENKTKSPLPGPSGFKKEINISPGKKFMPTGGVKRSQSIYTSSSSASSSSESSEESSSEESSSEESSNLSPSPSPSIAPLVLQKKSAGHLPNVGPAIKSSVSSLDGSDWGHDEVDEAGDGADLPPSVSPSALQGPAGHLPNFGPVTYSVDSSSDESDSEHDDVDEAEDGADDSSTVNFVCQKSVQVDTAELACVKFSPCGTFLAACGWSKPIKIYSWPYDTDLQHPYLLRGHTEGCSEISWSPDSKSLISASDDKTMRVWSIENFQSVNVIKGHKDMIMCVNFNPQGSQIISGSFDKTVRFWDARKAARQIWKKDVGDMVCSVQFNPEDGSDFITAINSSKVCQWNTRSKKAIYELGPSSNMSTGSAQYTPDGQSVLASFHDSRLKLWKPKTNAVTEFVGHSCGKYSIFPAIFENDIVIHGSDDGKISVWRRDNQELIQTLVGHSSTVIWIAAHPKGEVFASADLSGQINWWKNMQSNE